MTALTAYVVCLAMIGMSAAAQSWQPVRVVGLEYPEAALVRGLEGIVEVQCYLTQDGRVSRGEALSGDEVLASAAIRNAMQWKFRRVDSGPNRFTLVYRFVILRGAQSGLTPHFRFVMPKDIFVTAVEIPEGRPLK
jgi:hypothetical protein